MQSGMVDATIFAILTTGAVLIVVQLGRLLRASMQHRTIREAISRDNGSVPDLLAGFDSDKAQKAGANDDRTAFILIALGISMVVFAWAQNSDEAMRTLGAAAIFPVLVGAALLVRFYIARKRDQAL